MSELANNLLDAIVSGDKEQMSSAFSDVMNAKINDSLQARKIELAQRIYGDAVQDHSSDIDDADISDEASDNGTEEV